MSRELTAAEGELAILDIIEGRYFLGFWFVDAGRCDWFAAVWRDKDQPWRAMYRFRYAARAGKDGYKTVYALEGKNGEDDEQKLVAAMQMAGEMTAETYKSKLHFVEVRSDHVETVVGTLIAQPWAHLAGLAPGGTA